MSDLPAVDSLQLSPNPLAVSFRFLLSLYAIVPACVLLQLLDTGLLNQSLLALLPSSPSHFLLFQVLFGTPHIIASTVLLLGHADYRQAFKKQWWLMTAAIVLFFGVGSLFIPYRVLYIITACWTVYHVLRQQHGIAKAVSRLPTWAFHLQLWLSITAGIAIYLGVFLHNSLSESTAAILLTVATVLCVCLSLSTVVCQRYAKPGIGTAMLWANTLLVLASGYVYSQHYYFLAILMPRLVHDLTAYSFYISHDVNRHGQQPQLWLYKAAKRIRIPVAVVLPLLSFALTFLLQQYGDALVNAVLDILFSVTVYKAVTLGVLGYLALMHYYTEAFVWSAGSPLRRFIVFRD